MNWLEREGFGEFLNEAGLCGIGVEVGGGSGRFASTLLSKWQGRGVTLVDTWEPQPARVYFDIHNDASKLAAAYASAVKFAEADPRVGLLRMVSPEAASSFVDGSLDWVYLDGNHSYPAVSADLRAWYPKLRPGGVLSGSSYRDGIVHQSLFGVKSAVDRFGDEIGRAPVFTPTTSPIDWYFRKAVGQTPSADRLTLLTAYDVGYAAIGDLSRANKDAYCQRHGYRFVCRTDGFDPTRAASWSKVRFLLEELPRADWVFWSDADALVMNSTVPLTRFVQDSVDVVFSGDPYHGINCGHILVRNTPWSLGCLERVWNRTEFLDHPFWENAAVIQMYAEDAEVRRHTVVVPNKLFNGFPYERGGYTEGDFIVHFAGCRRPVLDAAMWNYAAMTR
jgi:hypothetical protein